MPRPSPDRVIQDWTFAILPVAAGFVLIILTVVALVYSIGVKTAIPEGLAIAFAGLAYGIFGLWMGGHLVRYCRGYYTRGGVAASATLPPLPLTGISTGEDGATMAADAPILLPISYQQPRQQSRQDQQDHQQQQRPYIQQYQPRQNQEQHQQQQQQCQQGNLQRPHVQSPPSPSPQGQLRQQQQPQREHQRQQRQQHDYPKRNQQPPPPHQDARGPNDTRHTLLNQVPTVLRPGPRQRQPPSDPNPPTDQKSSPIQRTSSVQLTPVEAYSGCRGHSLDVPRPLHRENRQVSRGPPAPRASAHDVAGSHPQENQSRVTSHHGDVNRDPRRASVRSTSLDHGTRQSLHAGTSQPPAVMPFGSGWADTGQHTSLTVAPLRIRKEWGQSQAPGLDGPRPSAWAPAGQHMQMSQHAGQARPNLHGPRPQPQSSHKTNGPQAIRMVSESPDGNDATAAQPGQAEVRGRHLAPALAPSPSPSPALRFEDIDHPGVQRTSQTSSALTAMELLKHVSAERFNASAAANFVLLPTYIFTHSQAVDPEGSDARNFGVLYEDAGDEKKHWGPRSGLRYKHDSGVIIEGPNDAE
ncbi:hypothetical protein LX32DRAFT_564721 [Colletotrichum zoysiae]|uniref:Uncharacterized protein n=1 Tax=Colletotrichum zoysiae TaxID=1216348 RepID=A0AAD9HG05_9PEZI|nr:hypothetical protein LX32DRAFT_564721 [Colletotrichum zoysiae]